MYHMCTHICIVYSKTHRSMFRSMRLIQSIGIEHIYASAGAYVYITYIIHICKKILRVYFVVPTTRSQYQMKHFFCYVAHIATHWTQRNLTLVSIILLFVYKPILSQLLPLIYQKEVQSGRQLCTSFILDIEAKIFELLSVS